VKMASAPGVELVSEHMAPSEGEAKPRFRGSIRLRPPFLTIAHGSSRAGGEADRQLATEQEEKGRSRADPRLAARRELPPPELGKAGRAVEAGAEAPMVAGTVGAGRGAARCRRGGGGWRRSAGRRWELGAASGLRSAHDEGGEMDGGEGIRRERRGKG
jgi:hypothetical protein